MMKILINFFRVAAVIAVAFVSVSYAMSPLSTKNNNESKASYSISIIPQNDNIYSAHIRTAAIIDGEDYGDSDMDWQFWLDGIYTINIDWTNGLSKFDLMVTSVNGDVFDRMIGCHVFVQANETGNRRIILGKNANGTYSCQIN